MNLQPMFTPSSSSFLSFASFSVEAFFSRTAASAASTDLVLSTRSLRSGLLAQPCAASLEGFQAVIKLAASAASLGLPGA